MATEPTPEKGYHESAHEDDKLAMVHLARDRAAYKAVFLCLLVIVAMVLGAAKMAIAASGL